MPFEDPDPGDVTQASKSPRDKLHAAFKDFIAKQHQAVTRDPVEKLCSSPRPDVSATMLEYYAHKEINVLRRDRDSLVQANARKLAKICALEEELAALKAATQPVRPEFPLRALRFHNQAVGLYVPPCFRRT